MKTATVPALSRVGSETAATSRRPSTAFSQLRQHLLRLPPAISNSEAISSGPLTPGPKPFVSAS